MIAVPLAVFCIVACSRSDNGIAAKASERIAAANGKIMFRGNEFEMSKAEGQKVKVKNPTTGVMEAVEFSINPQPVSMNGNPIYADNTTHKPVSAENPAQFMPEHAKTSFDALPDGEYMLSVGNIVADANGKVVYYDTPTISDLLHFTQVYMKSDTEAEFTNPVVSRSPLPGSLRDQLVADIASQLDNQIHFKPGTRDNHAVLSIADDINISFTVKAHHTSNRVGGSLENAETLLNRRNNGDNAELSVTFEQPPLTK